MYTYTVIQYVYVYASLMYCSVFIVGVVSGFIHEGKSVWYNVQVDVSSC